MANGYNIVVYFKFYWILKSPVLERLAPGDEQCLLAKVTVERKIWLLMIIFIDCWDWDLDIWRVTW